MSRSSTNKSLILANHTEQINKLHILVKELTETNKTLSKKYEDLNKRCFDSEKILIFIWLVCWICANFIFKGAVNK